MPYVALMLSPSYLGVLSRTFSSSDFTLSRLGLQVWRPGLDARADTGGGLAGWLAGWLAFFLTRRALVW